MLQRFVFALAAMFACASLAGADEVTVHKLDGKTVQGSLASIGGGEIGLKGATGNVIVPLSEVLAVAIRDRKPADPTYKYIRVVLTDDTELHCKDIVFAPGHVELILPSGAALKVPMSAMAAFLREANNQPLARKFEELAQKKDNPRDRIVIRRGETLSTLEGTLGEVKEVKGNKFIQFRTSTNELDVSLDKLHGIIFFRNPVDEPPRPICKIIDVDGNTLSARKVSFDGGKLHLTTTTGNELSLPEESLCRLDFNLGKLTFLSALVPAKATVKSGIGLNHSFAQDTNLDGDPILLDKKPYKHGLSMHSYTDLEYNLAGKFRELSGVLGVDTRTGDESEPKVTIYCDDRVVFSDIITARKVQPITLNVKGVRTLRIVVSSKNLLDLGDHVTLADGQLTQ